MGLGEMKSTAERLERSITLALTVKLVTVVGVPLAGFIALQAYWAFVNVQDVVVSLERAAAVQQVTDNRQDSEIQVIGNRLNYIEQNRFTRNDGVALKQDIDRNERRIERLEGAN